MIEDTTVEEWERVMSVNTTGVFLGTKHAIPEMRKAGGGSIVNISSIAGLVGSPRGGAYTTSKGGVRLFTKSTAIQHADNIGIPEGLAASLSRVPLGRVGTVDDVAYGALFLASDEASYMTGSELVIDGGVVAQ